MLLPWIGSCIEVWLRLKEKLALRSQRRRNDDKIIFERSSQKGGRQRVRQEGQQGTHLESICRLEAQEKQHFGKSHFY